MSYITERIKSQWWMPVVSEKQGSSEMTKVEKVWKIPGSEWSNER